MSPARLVVVTLTAIACHGALAQSAVPPALEVQRLAPQLVGFAGSDANFQSLVNGLAQGTAVQISSALPNGFTQTVTFTPAAPMTPAQIAQVLEGARQQLIGLGIASPTAEQIGFTLMGGVVPTALGGTPVAGALRPNPPSIAAQIQQANAAGGSTTSATPAAPGAPVATTPPVTSAVNVQLAPTPTTAPAASAPAASPTAQRLTSDSLTAPGATSRSPAASISATPPAAAAPTAPGTGSSPPAVGQRLGR
jgi:hypothetical protein